MRLISEKQGLEKLRRLKDDFAVRIRLDFENKAKSCMTCETPGACCLDAHFVNVRISRLEAAAIRNAIREAFKRIGRKRLPSRRRNDRRIRSGRYGSVR